MRLADDLRSRLILYIAAILTSTASWELLHVEAIMHPAYVVFQRYCDWKLPPTQVAVEAQEPQWSVVPVKSVLPLSGEMSFHGLSSNSMAQLAVEKESRVAIHGLKAGPWSCTTAQVTLTVQPAKADILVPAKDLHSERRNALAVKRATVQADSLWLQTVTQTQEFANQLSYFLQNSKYAPAEVVRNILQHKLAQPILGNTPEGKDPSENRRGLKSSGYRHPDASEIGQQLDALHEVGSRT